MYEVEAKVRLNRADFKRVKTQLDRHAQRLKPLQKEDRYYSDPKKHFLRLRRLNNQAELNLKSKKRERGIEINQEIELPIRSVRKFHRLLVDLGVMCTFKKTKKTLGYKYKQATVELNHVVGLGDYLEIETIVKSKAQVNDAQKKVDGIFGEFGFKKSDYESRYYIDLLTEKRKNK